MRRNCSCGDAGDNGSGKYARREISDRLHALCYRGAVSDVCRGDWLGADSAHRLWCAGREKGVQADCAKGFPPEGHGRGRGA